MIWIRADANSEIGMGHMMRCLSVADEIESQGGRVCFVVADENPVPLLEKRGKQYHVLHTDYRDMETELQKLLSLFSGETKSLVLIDSYFVTEKYFKELGKYVKTAYMDDKCGNCYPVDILINYNIYGDAFLYPGLLPETKTLFGTAYAPLRKEFQKVSYQVREQAEHVLITTGGSDKYNLAGQILEAALQDAPTKIAENASGNSLGAVCDDAESKATFECMQFHVVSGAFNQYFDKLCAFAKAHPNVHIHQNVTNMSELMQMCDIAVTAGGSTMYELSAVGVPVICFSFVDNQEQIVENFARKELVCYGGNYLEKGELLAAEVAEKILYLKKNKEARVHYSERTRALVDGRGAERLAAALLNRG